MSVVTRRPALSRTRILVAVTVLTLLATGVALAFWRGDGSGSATGATGTTSALTLTPGTPTAQLYPGGQANVLLTVANPSAATVRVGSLTLDTG